MNAPVNDEFFTARGHSPHRSSSCFGAADKEYPKVTGGPALHVTSGYAMEEVVDIKRPNPPTDQEIVAADTYYWSAVHAAGGREQAFANLQELLRSCSQEYDELDMSNLVEALVTFNAMQAEYVTPQTIHAVFLAAKVILLPLCISHRASIRSTGRVIMELPAFRFDSSFSDPPSCTSYPFVGPEVPGMFPGGNAGGECDEHEMSSRCVMDSCAVAPDTMLPHDFPCGSACLASKCGHAARAPVHIIDDTAQAFARADLKSLASRLLQYNIPFKEAPLHISLCTIAETDVSQWSDSLIATVAESFFSRNPEEIFVLPNDENARFLLSLRQRWGQLAWLGLLHALTIIGIALSIRFDYVYTAIPLALVLALLAISALLLGPAQFAHQRLLASYMTCMACVIACISVTVHICSFPDSVVSNSALSQPVCVIWCVCFIGVFQSTVRKHAESFFLSSIGRKLYLSRVAIGVSVSPNQALALAVGVVIFSIISLASNVIIQVKVNEKLNSAATYVTEGLCLLGCGILAIFVLNCGKTAVIQRDDLCSIKRELYRAWLSQVHGNGVSDADKRGALSSPTFCHNPLLPHGQRNSSKVANDGDEHNTCSYHLYSERCHEGEVTKHALRTSALPTIPSIWTPPKAHLCSFDARAMMLGGDVSEEGEILLNVSVAGKPRDVWRTRLEGLHLHTLIVAVDMRGDIVKWNSGLENFTSFLAADMMGQNILSLFPDIEAQDEVATRILSALDDINLGQLKSLRILSQKGETPTVAVDLHVLPARLVDGTIVGAVLAGVPSVSPKSGLASIQDEFLSAYGMLENGPAKEQLRRAIMLLSSQIPRDTREPLNISELLEDIVATKFSKKVILHVCESVPPKVYLDSKSLMEIVSNILSVLIRPIFAGVQLSVAASPKESVLSLEFASDSLLEKAPQLNLSSRASTQLRKLNGVFEDKTTARETRCIVRLFGALNAVRADALCDGTFLSPCDVPQSRITLYANIAEQNNMGEREGGRETHKETTGTGVPGVAPLRGADGCHYDPSSLESRFGALAVSADSTSRGASAVSTKCCVAVFDPKNFSSLLIRSVVWDRQQPLFFVKDEAQLLQVLTGVDILFARFPQRMVLQKAHLLLRERPALQLVIIAAEDGSESASIDDTVLLQSVLFLKEPILANNVSDALTQCMKAINERRKREATVGEIRQLFMANKSCPWVRGKLLGRGGFAEVFEATNIVTGGKMAVRTVKMDTTKPTIVQAMMSKVVEEVKLMLELDHRNIIHYLSMERDESTIHLFLEYASEGSLRRFLDTHGAQPPEKVAQWLHDVVAGLEYMHSKGIAHLDVKCANILLMANGVCKITDFGTAVRLSGRDAMGALDNKRSPMAAETRGEQLLSRSGSNPPLVAGTIHFMAPEVIGGAAPDSTADIWSLGCTAVEMLTGMLPFSEVVRGGQMAVVDYISHLPADKPTPIPGSITNPEAISFISSCLQVNPQNRPTSSMLLRHPFLAESNSSKRKRLVPKGNP